MASGFNFGSGLTNTTGSTGFGKTAFGTTTGTTTPLKLGAAAPTLASPLTNNLSTASTTPFKGLGGGLGGSLGGGLTAGTGGGLGAGLGGLSGGLGLGGTSTNPLAATGSTSLSTNPLGTANTTNPLGATGLTTATTNPLGTTTTTASTTGTTPAPATTTITNSTVTFKILEDYVNKWMNELDSQEKDFLNQATQLNALDKLMIENGDKIVDLSGEVDRLNSEQEQLEQELNFLYTQQTDLEGSIKKLEGGIEQMPTIPQQHCDTSRIEMYKLLVEVDNQLRSQSGDLRDIIKRLNYTNVSLNDPIMQVNKILNAHMDSLNWIEENTGLIQNQAENLSKTIDERMRESESSASKYSFLS